MRLLSGGRQDGAGTASGRCGEYSGGVKHWHGAAPNSWFSHLAVEVPGAETANEWLEAVSDGEYFKATGKLG